MNYKITFVGGGPLDGTYDFPNFTPNCPEGTFDANKMLAFTHLSQTNGEIGLPPGLELLMKQCSESGARSQFYTNLDRREERDTVLITAALCEIKPFLE